MKEEISIYEWVTAAIGLLLVVSSLGFMLFEGLSGPGGPPDVRVSIEKVERSGDAYVLSFRAENFGGSTAAGLEIEGRLSQEGIVLETSETTIDYLPPRSRRTGGLFFAHDPETGTVELRPGGFTDP